ncbi:hypothetical protein H2198_003623 [Neophaeococcomyces mojaviensis]|uniref:Uncharacterized protein n=1 Tax=Neophaeococcomyces mojaviensis TaxID=3383035 RepID=A0ACC3ABH0_9EURO|nr:hypothetical protein H2198_003623 [Knufia sp. JES_112]
MTRFDPLHESLTFTSLKDTVVVLTGGASGIGAATVRLLHSHGARVVFGDLDETAAKSVVNSTSSTDVHFLKTDVRSYSENLALFKLAFEKYGRVNHAIANAGLVERPGWFDPRVTLDALDKEPDLTVLDVNLKGVLYFAHIACTYLAHGNESERKDKSLTLLSSIAGWKESPGLFVYQASKHGVLGLMRSLRLYAPEVYPGVRVNAICPSFTDTRMIAGVKDGVVSAGLPVQTPDDVARCIVGVSVAGPGSKAVWYDEKEASGVHQRKTSGGADWEDTKRRGLNGRALHVLGGVCHDIDEGLDRTQELWLGQEMSKIVEAGQKGLGDGTGWVKGQ